MTKIDIISGFLGAGKTTFIKQLLREAIAGEKVVLIENEFGEIGIDGGFLKDAGIEIREMNSGCICCSLVGDFGKSLKEVLTKYQPDRVIIEPSGVGKLSDVMKAVRDVASEIEVMLNSAVTVVDVNKCRMYMKNFGEFFNNQIDNAGTIVLSRTDIAAAEKVQAAVEMLREHNAAANIVTTPCSQLTGAQLLEIIEKKDDMAEELMKEAREYKQHEHHHHDHGEEECGCHDHGHHHHHDHDEEEECGCHDHGHEHHHHEHEEEECGCHDHGHEHHHHDHGEEECGCHDHGHEHHHHDHGEEECGCHDHGHEHHHDHDEEECGCHDHEHHDHHHDHDHGENCTCGCHDHDHHDHHHADEVFTSWGRENVSAISREKLEAVLHDLAYSQKYGEVLRAKGMIPGEKEGIWLHFDLVPEQVEIREGIPDYTGKLCVIGANLDEEGLEAAFKA
ncbi:CobW family GTP-binding protein [uncultured Clostridium sp.]|uniref:CobW family GTP-binding protein n=1 Tax=uncultured Clostridium sp. TaxID=59620 RepID=UPI0025F81DD6|nr:CobW family GTP-binding protein [uncultured Clostridium sp.]